MLRRIIHISIILFIGFSFIILFKYGYKKVRKYVTVENAVKVAKKVENKSESTLQIAYDKYIEEDSKLSEIETIKLVDIDGNKKNYSFEYNGEKFSARFNNGSWRIVDSYKIKNKQDIIKICQELINIHPVKGRDRISYRTPDDMTYEWIQHNIAYEILPESSSWREHARNVDLNPDDQGKSLKELCESRIIKYK